MVKATQLHCDLQHQIMIQKPLIRPAGTFTPHLGRREKLGGYLGDFIVADIGGTHARFACADLNHLRLENIAVYNCADFSSIANAFLKYQTQFGLTALQHAAIAIACPVIGDVVQMTNLDWTFSIQALKNQLNLKSLDVINDFTAQAMSLSALQADDRVQIGQGIAHPEKPKVIIGAGTGLGVAHLISTSAGEIAWSGEGGHASWTAQTDQEWFIQRYLTQQYGHVSSERVLSGIGLENLYQAIAAFRGIHVPAMPAEDIGHLALTRQSSLAFAAVEQFFSSLGAYAGDLALMTMALGGVFITGGIVPKLLPLMPKSEFRTRFEAKGRFSALNRKIPTVVVTFPQPGLLGAAVYLKNTIHLSS